MVLLLFIGFAYTRDASFLLDRKNSGRRTRIARIRVNDVAVTMVLPFDDLINPFLGSLRPCLFSKPVLAFSYVSFSLLAKCI